MKRKYINILTSLLTTIALTLNYKGLYIGLITIDKLFILNTFTISLIYILILLFYNKNKVNITKSKRVLALIFSILFVVGTSYNEISSWNYIFLNVFFFLLSILRVIGFFYLFINIISLIDNFKLKLKTNKSTSKLIKFFNDKPFIASLIFILLCWLIYIIAFYPGLISKDASFQLLQFFNIPNKYDTYVNLLNSNVHLTNHHPVIHTLLIGNCIKIGRLLVNDNFGIFIYSIIQMTILAGTLSYTIKYLKKLKVSSKIRFVLLLIYALLPIFPFYSFAMIKDTIYSCFVILYTIQLLDIIKFYSSKKLPIKKLMLLFIIMIFMSLFRNNGVYLIYLSFPILIIFRKKLALRELVLLLIFILSMHTYNNILLPHYNITPGSIREVLSIPFQQTARLIKEDEKIIAKEDKIIISKVLDYEKIKHDYKPEIADDVKNTYNKDTTKKELQDYLKVLAKYLIKRPDIYIEATLNNTYGYFSPFSNGRLIYSNFNDTVVKYNIVDYSWNNLNILRILLVGIAYLTHKLPVLGLLTNIGFGTWIVLFLLVELIDKKQYKYIIVLLPLLISILICIASPVNEYFRYTMPYMFMIPFLLGIYINNKISIDK